MPSRSRRRFALACLGALMTLTGVAPAGAGASAEADLASAQRRANEAAAELSRAETALAQAETAVALATERAAQAQDRVETSRQSLRDLAIDRYVGGTTPVVRILGLASANEVVRAQGYAQALASSTADSLLRYRTESDDLRLVLAALEAKEADQAAALKDLQARQRAAVAEVERLARIVEEQRARAAREAAAAAPARAAAGPSSAPTLQTAATGGAQGAWVCPVAGPRAFSNDFGAPRGGGFSHQGNDILAPRGTPVVAHVAGVVVHRQNTLGGLAYFLNADDGWSYYGAHLDSYGASGRVAQGTVIGTVGDTGDARGGPPHLHFEMKRPDGVTINPYSTLVQYC